MKRWGPAGTITVGSLLLVDHVCSRVKLKILHLMVRPGKDRYGNVVPGLVMGLIVGLISGGVAVGKVWQARETQREVDARGAYDAVFRRGTQFRIAMEDFRDKLADAKDELETSKRDLKAAEAKYYSLSDAAARGDAICVRRLIRAKQVSDIDNALRCAVENNRLSTAQLLIDGGADVHSFDEESWETTINSLMGTAAGKGYVRMMQLLTQNGAKVTGSDWNCHTIVSNAVANRRHAAMKFLLKRGARSGSSRNGRVSDLMDACESGDIKAVEILLKYGDDVHWCDKWGHTALDYAMNAKHPAIARLLRRAGLHIRYDRSQDYILESRRAR